MISANIFAQTGTYNVGSFNCDVGDCAAVGRNGWVLTISSGGNIIITGSQSGGQVTIRLADGATATLNNAEIGSLGMEDNANATVILTGTNTVVLLRDDVWAVSPGVLTINGNGGTLNVGGDVTCNLTIAGGTVNITGNVSGNLTVSGGTVNVGGTVSGTPTYTGGIVTVGGITQFGAVPATGLPTLTVSTLLTIIFALLSVALWVCVISRRITSKQRT